MQFSRNSLVTKDWWHRSFMVLARIPIANTLLTSQFQYKLLCLLSPPTSVIADYKKILTQFIWEGGPSKIKYEKFNAPYDLCGLELIDLEKKNIALKTTWVKRLANDPMDR